MTYSSNVLCASAQTQEMNGDNQVTLCKTKN